MFPHSIVTLDSWKKVAITQFLPPYLQGFAYLKSTEKYSEFFVLIPFFNLLMTLLESLFILNWPSHFIKWDNRKSRIIHLLDLSGLPIKFASSIDQQEWQLENAPKLSETFLKILPTEGPWKKANPVLVISGVRSHAHAYTPTWNVQGVRFFARATVRFTNGILVGFCVVLNEWYDSFLLFAFLHGPSTCSVPESL